MGNPSPRQNNGNLKYLALLMLTTQQICMPLMARYTRNRASSETFFTTVNVLIMEIMKLCACTFLLLREHGSIVRFANDVKAAIWGDPIETAKILYQLKIFSTALLMRALLDRRLSSQQWMALGLLVLGAADVEWSAGSHSGKGPAPQNDAIGLAAVATMCFTSAVAGVYLERVLKGSSNIRLSLIGFPISLISMFYYEWSDIQRDGAFRGWDFWVVMLTATNSLGGLLISMVIKYADNILKAYAQMISRCFPTAICGASGILDAAPSETSTPKTRGELGHLKLTRPPAPIGEGAAVKGKGTNASRRTKAPKGVTTTTTTTAAPEISGSTKKKSLPIWQKLMNKGSTTPRIPTTEHDLEQIHEVISARGTEAEIKSTELPTDESEESEESTPSSTARTTGGGPKKQRRTATATPTTRVTWKPLVRATTISAGSEGPSHTSEKSTKEQTFWNRFQPNTWYQSIHYFTNTGR